MKTRVILVAVLAMTVLAPVGADAQQKPTSCESAVDMDLSPGFWREGNSGTFTTNGETGTVKCNGPVNGKQTTGPGSFGVSGRYGTKDPDTCNNAEGIYRASITVPTADGKEKWTNRGDWAAGAFKGGGAFGGDFTGENGDGTFEVTPKQGDCVSSPMTKIHVTVRWTMKR
jgi:hypothetical protein